MLLVVDSVQGLCSVVQPLSLSQDCVYTLDWVCTTEHCLVTETPDITLAPFTRELGERDDVD
jgi:hypothetical protein